MYLNWHERDAYVIDIETDGLDAKVIHVMCWRNVKTGEKGACIGKNEIQAWFAASRGSLYVGHNILKFDAPVLNRLAGARLSVGNCIDTLVLSTLYSPSLAEGHSLGAWGKRLGVEKFDFDDWLQLSPAMIEYCHQDCAITAELFRRLIKTLARIGFSEKSIEIQHKFTVIIDRQHRNGFYFDGRRAIELFQTLRSRQQDLEDLVHVAFPPELEELAHYKRAYKQDGSHSSQYLRHSEVYEQISVQPDGSYSVFGRTPFNIGSPKQRVEKLEALGWKCKEFTAKGGPTPFIKGKLAPSLEEFLETHNVPEVELIAKWMSINGRANMINTWLDNWNEDDSCIHGKLFVADTLRLRHQAPNTANIPAVRTTKTGGVLLGEAGYYTYETRDLWTARPKRVLVGTDAAGLELRMLANYLNRPEFTESVINGKSEDGTDVHSLNARLAEVERPKAKTLIYAIQYGAQDGKVAQIMECSREQGAIIRQKFLDRLGLTEVMNAAIAEQKNGRVELCDGAMVICPSPHSALNYKLQGGGARVMAMGSIILEGYIRSDGLDSLKVGDIHDEWQYDVHPSDSKQHAKRSEQAIREAGEELNLNVPLAGKAKEGLTWAETH